MNESMGSVIMRLRKEHEMTQEQLANALGITFQAVSKWENGVSSPDIAMLPLLADLFCVSIDELFGRTPLVPVTAPVPVEEQGYTEPSEGVQLPWPDDESMLHVVLFAGHRLIGADEEGAHEYSRKNVEFQYEGPALDIWSDFSVTFGDVQGNVTANGNVECDSVSGSVQAGGDVNCDDVGRDVNAGGNVNCDDVGGGVQAGWNLCCDDVSGNVNAGGSVSCSDVCGSVYAGNVVDCDSVKGTIQSGRFCPDGDSEPKFGLDRDLRDLDEEINRIVEESIRFSMHMSDAGRDLGQVISDTVQKTFGKYFQNRSQDETEDPEK